MEPQAQWVMRSERPATQLSDRLPYVLLPLVALLAVLPLFWHGCSCGHDIGFHEQSWLNAAQQFRHGTLYPAWATTPAFGAGEPRFLFYPPLSWMLGALLTLVLPFAAVPAAFTWLVLSSAGVSMYAVIRRLEIAPTAAFAASALYLANPYMLFTAIERTAYAELLAAVWIPWLFLALLRERPSLTGLAWPLALLWLTNAPAAVMGSYTLALLATLRVIAAWRAHNSPLRLAATYIGGAALGLALPAFYLAPAIHEQRFVQITMALVPGLSVPANFLFAHTGDYGHDFVNHQATRLALTLLLLTAALLWRAGRQRLAGRRTLTALIATTLLIAFLLEPLSKPIWMHLPELAFLQFPWRLLMILAAVFAFSLAYAAKPLSGRPPLTIGLTSLTVLALAVGLTHFYLQPCDAEETPAAVATLFRTGHGVSATDEYTPTTADNDIIRFNNPGYWLSKDPAAFAPGTIPNPNAAEPDHDFGEPPADQTLSQPAPHHLELNAPASGFLILNLRDYPNWRVTETTDGGVTTTPAHLQRDDGLIAIAVPSGKSTIDIHWRTGTDREAGAVVSLLAAALFGLCVFRSRRIVA